MQPVLADPLHAPLEVEPLEEGGVERGELVDGRRRIVARDEALKRRQEDDADQHREEQTLDALDDEITGRT
jgi:hypothetical protein